MTALDQAFAKAYAQQDANRAATPLEPAKAARPGVPGGRAAASTSPESILGPQPSGEPSVEVPVQKEAQVMSKSAEKSPEAKTRTKKAKTSPGPARKAPAVPDARPKVGANGNSPAATLDRALAAVHRQASAAPAAGPSEGLAIDGVSLQLRSQPSPTAGPDRRAAAPRCAPSEATRGVPAQPSAAQPFRPLLEVDAFQWPPECDRLRRAAADQWEHLAEQLAEQAALGRKLVAISGCRRGDGCTTLILSVAPRLVERGLKVLLVDADFQRPLLARRLGLLPEYGWERVLAGRAAPAEVIIESLQDRLALLPLCQMPSALGDDRGATADPSVSLGQVREHYDVVLIDLGRFHRHEAQGTPLEPRASWIEAVVLVRNTRSTPEEDLARHRRRIRAAGIHEVGIVENFA